MATGKLANGQTSLVWALADLSFGRRSFPVDIVPMQQVPCDSKENAFLTARDRVFAGAVSFIAFPEAQTPSLTMYLSQPVYATSISSPVTFAKYEE
jgi:hypothetical protein